VHLSCKSKGIRKDGTTEVYVVSETSIGIIYNEPAPSGYAFPEASMDVLVQVKAVEEALAELGYRSVRIPFTMDANGAVRRIMDEDISMAFNLCETVGEDPSYSGHPAALLELLQIPFSGSPSMALMLTTDKFITNRLLAANGIGTPNCASFDATKPLSTTRLNFPVIVKPRLEDASIGIEQESVFADEGGLRKQIRGLYHRFGPLVIEEYVYGREFNISLLGYPFPTTLPLAEISFSGFPDTMYPILGYRAKWDESSFEYHNTPRSFPQDLTPLMLRTIEETALGCFRLLMLRDYGRIDMRIDEGGKVHVLEANANPCLSPDAGFAAAAQEAGLSYSRMVDRMVCFMAQRSKKDVYQACRASG
jgi:D-alanine-D-alanine ligase